MTKPIPTIVKETRLTRRLPLRDFAKELGVSHMTIAQWEKGKADPSPEIVGRLLSSAVPWIKSMALDIYAAQQRAAMESALPDLTRVKLTPIGEAELAR